MKKPEYFDVAPGVWGIEMLFVNTYIIETDNNWILVDAGLKGSGTKIRSVAEKLFGKGTIPSAIILTHGHFDHIGALAELLCFWHVPVYAHTLELPYLKGLSAYPPPDMFAGGGLISLISWVFPRGPKNFGRKIFKLSEDGSLPKLNDWKYLNTPGHSPGHISLFRESDKTLIAGDAFVTAKQESIFQSFFTPKTEVSGPPKYFTQNWNQARRSVVLLANLKPNVAATGHGKPMFGKELQDELKELSANFDQLAMPESGRYVDQPAIFSERGVEYIPERKLGVSLFSAVFVISALAAFKVIHELDRNKSI